MTGICARESAVCYAHIERVSGQTNLEGQIGLMPAECISFHFLYISKGMPYRTTLMMPAEDSFCHEIDSKFVLQKTMYIRRKGPSKNICNPMIRASPTMHEKSRHVFM